MFGLKGLKKYEKRLGMAQFSKKMSIIGLNQTVVELMSFGLEGQLRHLADPYLIIEPLQSPIDNR